MKNLLTAKVIKKHNSLTDGYIPDTPRKVLPDRLLNALYYKFEKEGEEFTLSIQELKELLGITSQKDDKRIFEAIQILQSPIVIRDFRYQNKEVEWVRTPFLCRAVKFRSENNEIHFKIEPMVIEAVKQKGGYTPLDLGICNRFRSKYALKIYKMYRRYRSLPHNRSDVANDQIGIIKKSLQELNQMFSTNHTAPSKLFGQNAPNAPINRGLAEIEKVTGEKIHCFYDRSSKLFIFSWGRSMEDLYPSPECIIPTSSIEPFVQWYINHFVSKVDNPKSYHQKIFQQIISNDFGNLERYYQLFLLERGKDPKKCFDPQLGKFVC